ncbi:MAG TPA: autotransporter outer membrane beta-barrel domain-containing protein [Rhizomicrobium sp.]|nr:autotransporter outer membrane beta-barrel domain-containing protein [Rhizomicrobium sp.]
MTAATMALLSGPAFSADTDYSDITTKVTTNLKTSTAKSGAPSDILIETDGSVVVNSVTPIIEVDSSNIVTNKGNISNTGTTGAVGVQLDTGNSGALDSIGLINLSGSGSNKIGISIANPTGSTNTAFTGVPLPNAATPVTTNTIIDLEASSELNVTGDSSTGILLGTGLTANGDILIGGGINMAPTSASSSSGGGVVGVNLEGSMTGNFTVQSTGSIAAAGQGAVGYQQIGELDGGFTNSGSIQALGTTTPSTSGSTVNPEAAGAIIIENSITGGFYNAGPSTGGTATARANIALSGTGAAIDIFSGVNNTAPLTIGPTALTDANAAGFGFVNRGDIGATTLNANLNVNAIEFEGTPNEGLTVEGGFFNGGSITATSTTSTSQVAGGSTVVEGIVFGNYTTTKKLVNSDETSANGDGGGTISATVSGTTVGSAVAIDIQADGSNPASNASLAEIDNSGTISAQATSTDLTIANLEAVAIRDGTFGGTLTTIVNSGQITAGTSTLNNGLQIEAAIDLADSQQNLMLTNSGAIQGAIALGNGNDTITDAGTGGNTSVATIGGNISFGGGQDTLTIGTPNGLDIGTVTGSIQEANGGAVAVTINPGSSLYLGNAGVGQEAGNPALTTFTTDLGTTNPLSANLPVSHLSVTNGGLLNETLSQAFNVNASDFAGPIVEANDTGMINIANGAQMGVTFGSFVSSTDLTTANSQFVLLDARAGNLTIGNVSDIATQIAGTPTASKIPYLFTGSVCTFNVAGSTDMCTGAEPVSTTDSELVLNLTPKSATDLGLTGFAAKMFPIANVAVANDPALGAALINGVTNAAQAQAAYAAFAPDVTGSQRALAVSLTDQQTGPVGARQRALRMYANQDGDATMWGQEFTERLNVGNQVAAGGFSDSGFGFALGMDGGAPASGRYGAAFTFYSGDTSEKEPRLSKTTSEWYMVTGYTDWRGKGFFFDSQLSVGYGNIDGKRQFDFGDIDRVANGKRSAELASGGATAGVALTAGGTVIMPQISVDGMTMRQEGYTESNNGETTGVADDGFDLQVRQEYDNSLRSFAGLDVRQDMNFGDFFLQPEVRAGYRYDFLNAAEKLHAQFACSTITVASGGCGATAFDITGPDPAKGNGVLGASIATTTGAWSIGLNYDYIRGLGNGGGKDSVTQDGTLTLIGRI